MAEQKQIQKKIRFALSSQTSEENLSFVILLMLMSLVRTRHIINKGQNHNEIMITIGLM